MAACKKEDGAKRIKNEKSWGSMLSEAWEGRGLARFRPKARKGCKLSLWELEGKRMLRVDGRGLNVHKQGLEQRHFSGIFSTGEWYASKPIILERMRALGKNARISKKETAQDLFKGRK